MSGWGNVVGRKCPFRKFSIREVSHGESIRRGTVPSGKCQSGICPWGSVYWRTIQIPIYQWNFLRWTVLKSSTKEQWPTLFSKHSHKKRKDSLETRAKQAVLCLYVENQAILEPILPYRASKCKQTKEQDSEDYLWTHIFSFLRDYETFFLFSFFCQNANITGSNCAIIDCNLSKKHKLALSQK